MPARLDEYVLVRADPAQRRPPTGLAIDGRDMVSELRAHGQVVRRSHPETPAPPPLLRPGPRAAWILDAVFQDDEEVEGSAARCVRRDRAEDEPELARVVQRDPPAPVVAKID